MMLIFGLNVIVAVYWFVKPRLFRSCLSLCGLVLSLVSFGLAIVISVLVFVLTSVVLLTALLSVKLNTSVIVYYRQDIDVLNGEQFVDWNNIDILLT